MEKILNEVDRSHRFVPTVDNCGCQLRTCFGLPCAHELAIYFCSGLPIPLNCIDPFWTKLDLLPSIHVNYGDVGYDKVVEMFEETFNKQSIPVKFSLIRKLKGVFNPSQEMIVQPKVSKLLMASLKTDKVLTTLFMH
ncbi:hypothetical protein E3N88_38396 [Mikania micrantha]|uniref:SWIM-type domain-containing protein n=1 Tax=Mikania micrantha TaxID=192012 RepID=A0A5N6LTY2_9ASTR|nr:hypothetical protein E3N88_38396 [Mikania micrantha]